MSPLEQLFRYEVEFHRRFREAEGTPGDAAAAHTSFALQHGYEGLLRSLDPVNGRDVEAVKGRLQMAGDPRDVLAAPDSLKAVLGISILET